MIKNKIYISNYYYYTQSVSKSVTLSLLLHTVEPITSSNEPKSPNIGQYAKSIIFFIIKEDSNSDSG